jgi:hypothetical protein
MKAHFIREMEPDGRVGDGWVRVSRQDIESLDIKVTSESRQDDEFIYLKYLEYGTHDEKADAQTFYTAMMMRGSYFEQIFPHVIKLDGEKQTFEVLEGLSDVRDLEAVA